MRSLAALFVSVALATAAHATLFTFQPNDGAGVVTDMNDLDHHAAYTWGITNSALRTELLGGKVILSATLTITNIYDWQVEPTNNKLFINLLDGTKSSANNIQTIADNTNDNVISNYFSTPNATYFSASTDLTNFVDPDGPANPLFDFIYNFSATDRGVLRSYIINTTASGKTDFGLGFDPDCHYYNDGICLTITTGNAVPDGSLTFGLVGLGFLALAAGRRRFRA